MKTKTKRILYISITIVAVIFVALFSYFFFFFNKSDTGFTDDELSVNPDLNPNVINVALFGIDEKESDNMEGTRTDTIIIASINKEDQSVKLTTILRDTFVMAGIPDKAVREEEEYTEDLNDKYNYLKLNAAYNLGGIPTVIKTLNLNFGLNIRNYALLNFETLREIVDLVDGIEVDIPDQNVLDHMNALIKKINEDEGRNDPLITSTGKQTLTGAQALAYVRDRSYADDESRTKKQREVIEQIYTKLKDLEVSSLVKALFTIYPQIDTSMSVKDLVDLLTALNNRTEPFQTESVPLQEYSRTGVIGITPYLFPYTLVDNVKAMQKFIYGQEVKIPEAVEQISNSLTEQYSQTREPR